MSKKDESERTVIDVVHGPVRILRVVDNDWATKPITILKIVMGVIPKCARLAVHIKLVEERISRHNRTLRHESSTIESVRMVLEQTMPVLHRPSASSSIRHANARSYQRATGVRGLVRKLVLDIDFQAVSLASKKSG